MASALSYFLICSVAKGYVMDIPQGQYHAGTIVYIQYDTQFANPDFNQIFKLVPAKGENRFHILSQPKGDGRTFAIDGTGTEGSFLKIQNYDPNSHTQVWHLVEGGGKGHATYYVLHSSDGLVPTVNTDGTLQTPIKLEKPDNTNKQAWLLIPIVQPPPWKAASLKDSTADTAMQTALKPSS